MNKGCTYEMNNPRETTKCEQADWKNNQLKQ